MKATVVAIIAALLLASTADAVRKVSTAGMGPYNLNNFTTNTLMYARGTSSYVTHIDFKPTLNTYTAQEAFVNGTYNWAISDLPLQPDLVEMLPAGKGVSTIPIVFNYVSFFHNITNWWNNWDFDAYPRLGPDLVAKIITGDVNRWNDDLVVSYNNGTMGATTLMNFLTPANASINFVAQRGPQAATYWVSYWLDQNKAGRRTDTNYRGENVTVYPYMAPYDWPYGVTAEIPWKAHIKVVDTPWDVVNYINNTANSLGYVQSSYGLNYSDSRGWGVQWWDGVPIAIQECELMNRDMNNLTSQENTMDVLTSFWQQRLIYTLPSTKNLTAWNTYLHGFVSRPGYTSYPLLYMNVAYTWTNLTSLDGEGAMIKQWLSTWQTDKSRTLPKKYFYRMLTDALRNNSIWGCNNLTTIKPMPTIWQTTNLVDTFVFA